MFEDWSLVEDLVIDWDKLGVKSTRNQVRTSGSSMLQKMYLEKFRAARDFRSEGEHSEGVGPKKLDFLFYWRALTKNRWPIALFTAFVTAIAIFYAQTTMPVFAANATLLLESQRANISSIEDLVSSDQESLDYYGTQLAILGSRALAERVIRQLEQHENLSQTQFAEMLSPSKLQRLIGSLSRFTGPDRTSSMGDSESISSTTVSDGVSKEGVIDSTDRYDDTELNEILSQFRQSLSIIPVAKTKLVTIVYESTDPEFSALAANAVADQYIESVLDRRNAFKDVTSKWMDGRAAELKSKLEESEEALLSFKRSNDLVDLNGGVGRLNEQELLLTSSELAEVRSELSNATDLYGKIQLFKASTPQLLETLSFVQNDLLVRSVKTEIAQAQRNLVELKNRFGPRHPVMVDAQSRLESLSLTLNGHIERAVATFENDYQLLKQRVASLEANVVSGKENLQTIGQQKITLEALEREVTADREQYNRLYDRITETRITEGLDEANAVVAEAAWVPTDPIKPNKMLIIGLAMSCSLMLAAVVSLLIEYLDDTVSSKEDVEKRLKTKLLAVLPLVKQDVSQQKNALPLTPLDIVGTSETFSEAVNTCRTTLSIRHERSLNNARDLQVILVTSSVPDEGKSTVALNLAYSFGKLQRTLLLDCDLRRPSIARALGMPGINAGLSSLLEQKSPAVDCFKFDVLNSFDCMTSGPIPDQPLEMLASAKFALALEKLRKYYDKIIIDSSPTHVVSDALVLSKLSDGVVYVVKPHDTPIKLVHSGLTRLAEAKAPVIGVCMTQVDINRSKSYEGLDFHGFGMNYHGLGSFYGYSGKLGKRSEAKPRGLHG